jgi:MYXO-CTERM domain-containing protein
VTFPRAASPSLLARTSLALALTAVAPALLPAQALAAPGTQFPILLRPLTRGAPFVTTLTEAGVVGGNSFAVLHERACLWSADGTPTELTPSYDFGGTSVVDADERGDLITAEEDARDPEHLTVTFRLRRNGMIVEAGALGLVTLKAINHRGEAVGTASSGRVKLWRDSALIDVGVGIPIDLNDAGQVLVDAGSGAGGPYVWQDGKVTHLGELVPGFAVQPTAMNEHGHVVGDTQTSRGHLAFLWKDGAMVEIGAPGGYSTARDINAFDQIVGETTSDGPYLWQDGQRTPLRSLVAPASGWRLASALLINDAGRIVGNAFLGQDGHDQTVVVDLPSCTGPGEACGHGRPDGGAQDAGGDPDAAAAPEADGAAEDLAGGETAPSGDAGPPGPDGAAPAPDTATVAVDASAAPLEAGIPRADAGADAAEQDAASLDARAGADAGADVFIGGTTDSAAPEAGVSPAPEVSGGGARPAGCACSFEHRPETSPASLGAALAAVVWFRRRRRPKG